MIPEHLRTEIQGSYTRFLDAMDHKPRSGQKQMIAAITRRLMHSQPIPKIIAVEAGTGTGKTLAYLLAALPIARELGKTLVVSTGTIALQEQLVYKDIPDVISKAGQSFGFSLVKGRGRYLCQLKLEQLLSGGLDDDQMGMYLDGEATAHSGSTLKLYQSMSQALSVQEWNGDRDAWDDTIDESDWRPLTSDRFQCIGRNCPYVGDCAFFAAREEMEEVLCLVTNHDLVLSDLALGGGAILPPPEDCIYVFDEAHHLGDKARNHFSSRFRLGTALMFCKQLEDLLPKLQDDLSSAAGITSVVRDIQVSIPSIVKQITAFRAIIVEQITDLGSSKDQTEHRFPRGILPPEIQQLAKDMHPMVENAEAQLQRLVGKLEELLSVSDESGLKKHAEAWFPMVGQWHGRIQAYLALWHNLATVEGDKQAEFARWCKYVPVADDYELFSSPIVANDILHDQLWARAGGAVLTSATLTALGQFDRLKMRTGLPDDFDTLRLLSPFDYQENAELSVPKAAPDPKDYQSHDQYLIDELPNILDPECGNLVLFSSARQMDTVYENLSSEWQKRILIQGSRSKQKLIDMHRSKIDEGKGSTLFGLASFAEGIDLPGAYCVHVVIAKIPFSVPTAPEEEAFAEWIESKGGKPFFDISLPDASMRLVQATGRLLRSENDQGKISIIDNRLLTKSYGRQLISALPPYRFSPV